jgi:hypothetical protein
VSNKTLLFLKVAFLLSFLFITIAGCSTPAASGDAGRERNEASTAAPSDAETDPYTSSPVLVSNTTPPGTEDIQPPGDTISTKQPFSTFYVSKGGTNTNGRSWHTAWNELDQIRWEVINPGDTIVIGGDEYHTQLDIEKSGAPGVPITITTTGEQVVLDGRRPVLPYCGQMNYIAAPDGDADDAIDLENQNFIVIDGQNWSGIVIKNHVRGIKMREGAGNIIVRNVEIHDNGYAGGSASNRAPDGPGVRLGGSDILFERVIIHDNGQDAFQAGWGVWNFTLRDSWLYNSRQHPAAPRKVFNYCSHTDGIQIYDGGVQGPVVIENSIIGPSFTQGFIIGNSAIVDNVVIKNTLFVGNDNAGIIISDGGRSSNWMLQNVTIVQDPIDERSGSLTMNGSNHHIRESLFWGGTWGIMIFNRPEAIGNFNWLTPDRYNVAEEMDPMFVDAEYGLVQGAGFADFDFTVQNPEIPLGTGSSITSVTKLFDQ